VGLESFFCPLLQGNNRQRVLCVYIHIFIYLYLESNEILQQDKCTLLAELKESHTVLYAMLLYTLNLKLFLNILDD
jgi:hypothetical protein